MNLRPAGLQGCLLGLLHCACLADKPSHTMPCTAACAAGLCCDARESTLYMYAFPCRIVMTDHGAFVLVCLAVAAVATSGRAAARCPYPCHFGMVAAHLCAHAGHVNVNAALPCADKVPPNCSPPSCVSPWPTDQRVCAQCRGPPRPRPPAVQAALPGGKHALNAQQPFTSTGTAHASPPPMATAAQHDSQSAAAPSKFPSMPQALRRKCDDLAAAGRQVSLG